MDGAVRGELHYITADLDSPAWVEAGLARLEAYLVAPVRGGRPVRSTLGGARIARTDGSSRSRNLDLLAWAALALRLLRP